MEQLGHSDARLTLGVYARAMRSDAEERARLTALVEDETLGTIGHWLGKTPPARVEPSLPRAAKTQKTRGIRAMKPTGIEPVTSRLQSSDAPPRILR